jgi:hypothetical protein
MSTEVPRNSRRHHHRSEFSFFFFALLLSLVTTRGDNKRSPTSLALPNRQSQPHLLACGNQRRSPSVTESQVALLLRLIPFDR